MIIRSVIVFVLILLVVSPLSKLIANDTMSLIFLAFGSAVSVMVSELITNRLGKRNARKTD